MENIFHISGKALKNARKAIDGLTQEILAGIIGIDRTTYNQWEKKESIEITKDQMEKLIKRLNVTLDVLTYVPRGTLDGKDILDHPVIKSLVDQSNYIMGRVRELEDENRRLRGQ